MTDKTEGKDTSAPQLKKSDSNNKMDFYGWEDLVPRRKYNEWESGMLFRMQRTSD